MRFFSELCPALQIGQQPADQSPWFHIVTLLTKVTDPDQRERYAICAVERAWSRAILHANIKAQLHLREGAALTSFAQRLPEPQVQLAQENPKDPYHFDFLGLVPTTPTNGTSKTPWSGTSPASCLNSAQGSCHHAACVISLPAHNAVIDEYGQQHDHDTAITSGGRRHRGKSRHDRRGSSSCWMAWRCLDESAPFPCVPLLPSE
jgi:DUF1016 N-terminal domain